MLWARKGNKAKLYFDEKTCWREALNAILQFQGSSSISEVTSSSIWTLVWFWKYFTRLCTLTRQHVVKMDQIPGSRSMLQFWLKLCQLHISLALVQFCKCLTHQCTLMWQQVPVDKPKHHHITTTCWPQIPYARLQGQGFSKILKITFSFTLLHSS